MNIFKKIYRILRYRKPFIHPCGMKFNSYQDFSDWLNPRYTGTASDYIKCLKRNASRGQIYFDENMYADPHVLMLAHKNKLRFIKNEIENLIHLPGVIVAYKALDLKWYEGWFPRYVIKGLKEC